MKLELVPSHVCTVCQRPLDKHSDISLCCPGCDCGSYERSQEAVAAGARTIAKLKMFPLGELPPKWDCHLCKDGEMLCGSLEQQPSASHLEGRRMTFKLCPAVTGASGESLLSITGVVLSSDHNSVLIRSKAGERYIRDRHVISMERTPPRWWRVLAFVFKTIRPLFVRDSHPNEDYLCVICGKPVLRRYLTCSKKCGEAFDKL